MIKKLAVLTSGGDAPGMNAAIRGVVRTALVYGIETYGVKDGYLGLYENNIRKLERSSVSDVINRGGTFLGSARFPEFKLDSSRQKAIENLRSHDIDALVVIGGDGSYMGAMKLTQEGFPCVCIPGTIDNDIQGTDYTVGYYTALETAVGAIDKLRDTCSSHHRISIIEIMGRGCGDLTLNAAVAGGCEYIVIPEIPFSEMELIDEIKAGFEKGKSHAIVAVAEHMLDVHQLAKKIEAAVQHETRATVLGHIQRGGTPVPFDRILGSRMGAYAVELLREGHRGRSIGVINGQLVHHDIVEAITNLKRPFDQALYDMAKKLY